MVLIITALVSLVSGYFTLYSALYFFRSAELVGWLVVLGLRPFETVFQSISGRLPKRGRKRREKDR